eukprot:scaffold44622_cov18-Tisochrysis_lutea.AAC.1
MMHTLKHTHACTPPDCPLPPPALCAQEQAADPVQLQLVPPLSVIRFAVQPRVLPPFTSLSVRMDSSLQSLLKIRTFVLLHCSPRTFIFAHPYGCIGSRHRGTTSATREDLCWDPSTAMPWLCLLNTFMLAPLVFAQGPDTEAQQAQLERICAEIQAQQDTPFPGEEPVSSCAIDFGI